jgi:ubiquinone biosynthesis protein UbiJ
MARDNKGATLPKFGTPLSELMKLADTRTLWQLAGWGGAATVALLVAVLMSTANVGAQRTPAARHAPVAATAGDGTSEHRVQVVQIRQRPIAEQIGKTVPSAFPSTQTTDATPPPANQAEISRLEAEVRQLAADRDRLQARVASLEQNLNDMTGSIKRELALVAATATAPPPAVGTPPTVVADETGRGDREAGAATAGDNAARVIGDKKSQERFVTKPLAKPVAKTLAEHEPADGPDEKSSAQSEGKSDGKSDGKPEIMREARAEPPAEARIKALPGQPVITLVPLPPIKAAALPPPPVAPGEPELGIELGGARSMDIMKKRWAAVKSHFGPLIEGMHPLVTYDDRNHAIPYRLHVGPLANGAAAAALCKRFAASRVSCRTTAFIGEAFADR